MNTQIRNNLDTTYIPVQRLTALLEIFTLKHTSKQLPDLLERAEQAELSYKSSNKKVVLIDVDGNAVIRGAGTAKIIVTAAETDEYAPAVKDVTVNDAKAANAHGYAGGVEIEVYPSDETDDPNYSGEIRIAVNEK